MELKNYVLRAGSPILVGSRQIFSLYVGQEGCTRIWTDDKSQIFAVFSDGTTLYMQCEGCGEVATEAAKPAQGQAQPQVRR